MISIKSRREIEKMRKSGELASRALAYAGTLVRPGVSTLEINDLVHDFILKEGARPSPLNYHGFPKSICTSKNNVICHGIPSAEDILEDGDILNIDVTTCLDGFHGDTNRTFFVGESVSDEAKKLVDMTYKCMMAGIDTVRPGSHLGDIGAAIQQLAESNGYSVVRDYCGHGIGREFHEAPQVLHYGTKGAGVKLKKGMTFTVEPMINLGSFHCVVLEDDWTVITEDGKWSAQFEHTIVVTDSGYEILTDHGDIVPGL